MDSPKGYDKDVLADWHGWQWNEEWAILKSEVSRFIKTRIVSNTAPGPDGFKATLWKKVPDVVIDRVTACLNTCLMEGIFPEIWKKANLVLIPKESKDAESGLSKVQPICLLDETGKTFERVIAERLNKWLDENPYVILSEHQYGFRKQTSTCDAIMRVKAITSNITGKGGVAIVVGIDTENAFNSLPWWSIRKALLSTKECPSISAESWTRIYPTGQWSIE